MSAAVSGFALGLSFIVAIGAQNALVLRQGLRREHVGPLVALYALCDAPLMLAGVAGPAQVPGRRPLQAQVLTAGGMLFLGSYGVLALRRALRPATLRAAEGGTPLALRAAVLQALGFALLNPHAYLDTLAAAGQPGRAAAGPREVGLRRVGRRGQHAVVQRAVVQRAGVWRALAAPEFARPRAWQVLDVLIGLVMLALTAGLG